MSKQILQFWNWFEANVSRLEELYSCRQFDVLGSTVNEMVDSVDPRLAWEIGPGKNRAYLFTISSEGNPTLRPIAQQMLRAAPDLKGWEFYCSRPPRRPAGRVHLPDRNLTFDTTNWKFRPLEHFETGRLDLTIVDDALATADREASLKAVSIYLDELLGEDAVEMWLGRFDVAGAAGQSGELFNMSELPDYLFAIIHRQENPLRSSTPIQ